jgi:hypothetical protein
MSCLFFYGINITMSSIGSSLRQIPLATTYYNPYEIIQDVVTNGINQTHVYEFVADSGNYVGNYPPGYMQPASAELVQNIDNVGFKKDVTLRDMGKTIYARDGNKPTANKGYFRQVQLIVPKEISLTQGFLGGVNGTTFGVIGGPLIPDNYTNYLTFYIPVSIGGAGLPQSATTKAYCLAGGQM